MILHRTEVNLPKSPRFRDTAYAAIKEAVLSGTIELGEPLLEEKLVAALGMSRTPVREALAILEHERLLTQRTGRGHYIRELTRKEFLDMFTANEVVEPYLARHAAVAATEEDMQAMRKTIDIGVSALANLNAYESLRSGREFHSALGYSAGNEALTRLVVRNEEQVDLYLVSLGDSVLLSAEFMQASNQEHEDILAAIVARDPDAASRLVIFHAQSLRRRYERFFSDT
jgi:DNA-binding GntR family transcriptional regulator